MESDSDQLLNDLTLKCTAGGTRIATSSGEKAIGDLYKGDSVLAFSVKLESGKLEFSSSEAKVIFSEGGQGQNKALYINFGEYKEIICTLDQPFLLRNGKYARGSKLRTGQELVDAKGNAVVINSISLIDYSGMINNIAVDDFKFTSPNGHLLLAQGIIIGDFAFQLSFDSLPDNLKE
ncbi:hypothetical protein BSF41_25700 [Flavobacterium sp. ACN2]|uniref:polymorphic toxin-type HINT domain-containing protein n=1 Tax=unclassified Flavobacterium TaxID=196869 RepID=UPI000BB36A3B|nr:polymorphic toxin-type HINT domain-containing protein [Flavobacterium sp. ACN2]PBI88442.1 hypothetical protein BSF41_25700 [Flavobacterium sp. ACN2]